LEKQEKNRPMKNISITIAILTILFLSTCGSKSIKTDNGEPANKREDKILKQYSKEQDNKYSDLIVDIKKYTTNGAVYQKKYYKLLIGVAVDIVDNKKLRIVRGSIGFYYDKKSRHRNKLYLGLDIDTGLTDDNQYGRVAVELLKKNIREISDTVNSCRSIFQEKEVVGMVIGLKWRSSSRTEQVNLWINEDDIIRFEKRNLTFGELIQKSTITNTRGNIIKLQL
jgi:hypothetical protein